MSVMPLTDAGPRRGSVVVGMNYPMYLLPVQNLFNMTAFVPHQDLLAAGKLVECE